MSSNDTEDSSAISVTTKCDQGLIQMTCVVEAQDQNKSQPDGVATQHAIDQAPYSTSNTRLDFTNNIVIDKNDNFGSQQTKPRKHKRINKTNHNQKVKMRAPQPPGMVKKLSHKAFKAHLKNCKQVIKAELENLHNAKSQTAHRKQHSTKSTKQNLKKMIGIGSRAAQFALRSKFFLPAKRPRKEVMIPPTKFLLGGNISDPLNLNGLQNESQNPTPNQTPQQSPITTPPKVEVIIPPNIYDPLHLLDPVDSAEYEKQLVSPMKRKPKPKHRHRKKKPKRKSTNEATSDTSLTENPLVIAVGGPPCTISCPLPPDLANSDVPIDATGDNTGELVNSAISLEGKNTSIAAEVNTSGVVQDTNEIKKVEDSEGSSRKDSVSDPVAITGAFGVVRSTEKEKPRDLKLDLSDLAGSDQHSISSGSGRKRRISEGPNKNNKFRRVDAMDKIVSPVVPQPGAWKRPPRTIPTGARKGSRLRSTSVSENELVSPTDDTKTFDSESIRCDTPEVEILKPIPENETVKDSEMVPPPEQHKPKQSSEKLPKFRKDGDRYQYGNFDRYSGYRNINEIMDVRLEVFHRNAHLFRGKDILDIGCNAGHITIAVAKDMAPKSILGLDIDKNLIARARKNLSMYVRVPRDNPKSKNEKSEKIEDNGKSNMQNKTNVDASTTSVGPSKDKSQQESSNNIPQSTNRNKNLNRRKRNQQSNKNEKGEPEFFPISFPITYGPIREIVASTSKDSNSPPQPHATVNQFPKNTFFRCANYVLKDESLINSETQQYDVILCLSVTKWIHLNFGDAGLKLAFKRMFNQLRPGGKLILEAQNWASYRKKKNLTETIYNNYKSIEFFPNKFNEYLLSSEVGFSHSYCLGAPRHMNKGFCRPIQLYAKGDYTPNHIRWSDNYHPQTPYETYRGIYAGMTRPPYPVWGPLDTPRGNSGSYSCRQTPVHPGLTTSQYYNPLESDSYLPSYDNEVQNRHYVFASPLYQTVWSPPPSLRNPSNRTPVFGSIREADSDECVARHVYLPTDFGASPQAGGGSAFNSVREPDHEDGSQQAQSSKQHVYANCEDLSSSFADNSSSPQIHNSSSSSRAAALSTQNSDQLDSNEDTENDSTVNVDVDDCDN